MRLRQVGKSLAILIFLSLLPSCSKGPETATKGGPEWNFQAAQESFRRGEYENTEQNLEKVENVAGNPYQARAAVWHMVMETGYVTGYAELIDAYDKGGLRAGAKKLDYLRLKQADLTEAKRHGLHLLEAYPHFEQSVLEKGSANVVLEAPFPQGSALAVPDLERVYKGMWMVDDARALMHQAVLKRGMIRGFSAAITSADDSPGAQKVMEKGTAQIPTAKFVLAMGQSFAKTAPLFGPKMLNETDKEKLFWEKAQACTAKVLELKPDAATEKEAKKLKADVDKGMKAKK